MQRTLIYAFGALVLAGAVYFGTRHSGGSASKGAAAIQWTDIDKGTLAASSDHKKIIIDVFTDWCSWCKVMDKQTYGDTAVAQYVQDHFVAVKLNAESKTERVIGAKHVTDAELASAYNVTGFPTTIFANADGSVITAMDGFVKPDEFKKVLRYIAEEKYQSMPYDEFKKTIAE